MSGIHDDIFKYLPHREPFLFVDEVMNINKGSDCLLYTSDAADE